MNNRKYVFNHSCDFTFDLFFLLHKNKNMKLIIDTKAVKYFISCFSATFNGNRKSFVNKIVHLTEVQYHPSFRKTRVFAFSPLLWH